MSIELNDQQLYAVYDMKNWWTKRSKQVFEISGGPGTGKTTIVSTLIQELDLSREEVLFATFMGKAANRLAMTGLPAKTIHSTIYNYSKEILRDENHNIIYKKNGLPAIGTVQCLKERLPKHIKLLVLDEGYMIPENLALDVLSFGIPVIVLGDINQLPPVMGRPYFLKDPDVHLTQIMRQAEDDPIVYICHQLLHDRIPRPGIYGRSAVIKKSELNDYYYNHADMILTSTNKLRYQINNHFRRNIKKINSRLDYPRIGERVICRKNNWGKSIDGFFMTNGTIGTVADIDKASYNGTTMVMDFKPDFLKTPFVNVKFNYDTMFSSIGNEVKEQSQFDVLGADQFEFAYAITVHLSQGSEADKVLFLSEMDRLPNSIRRATLYTAASRASKELVFVLP